MFRSVMSSGAASTYVDQLLPLNRHGFPEECYFVFSYSPVMTERGGVGGVFVTVLETTERVLRDRRQKLLRELMAIPAHRRREEILAAAADILSRNSEDLCFVRLYAGDVDAPATVSTPTINPEEFQPAFDEACEAKLRTTIGPVEMAAPIACGPWPESVTHVVRVPIAAPGAKVSAGALEVGLSRAASLG